MMKPNPLVSPNLLVSVIIPVLNQERYLAAAIESVLAQAYRPIQVIVVDDGSTDRSAEIAAGFPPPVEYVWRAHGGIGAARNLGIECARGDFFAFADSDDLWMENKLALQMQTLAHHPEADIVSGHIKQFFSPELSEEWKARLWCPEQLSPGYVVGAMVMRREAFFRVGLFDTGLKVGDAMSWYLRAEDAGLRLIMLPDCVYMRRIHDRNTGITQRQFIDQRAQIIKAALDRRRLAQKDSNEHS